MPGPCVKIDEDGGIAYDEDGGFSLPATSPAVTPMSKATPKSQNQASPHEGARPWTGSLGPVHSSPPCPQPPQDHPRRSTRRAKNNKGFFEAYSRHVGENDQEDGDLSSGPASGRRAAGTFDTDPIPSCEDNLDDDQLLDKPPTLSSLPARKGIPTFSSAPPSVADSIDEEEWQKMSSKMRGKSAEGTTNTNPGSPAKKPTDRCRSNRKSIAKPQLPALSLESEGGKAKPGVDNDDEDPFSIDNLPSSPDASSENRETERLSKKRPTTRRSKILARDKKPLSKSSKITANTKKLARSRQKAKPSAAEIVQENVSSGSGESREDDEFDLYEAEIRSPANFEQVPAPKKPRVRSRASESITKQPPFVSRKESKYLPTEVDGGHAGTGKEDHETIHRSGTKPRPNPKPKPKPKQPLLTKNITTRFKAASSDGMDVVSGVDTKRKKPAAHDDGDSLAAVTPPKQSIKIASSTPPAPKKEDANVQAEKEAKSIAPPHTSSTRQTPSADQESTNTDSSQYGPLAKNRAQRPVSSSRQENNHFKASPQDDFSDPEDTLSLVSDRSRLGARHPAATKHCRVDQPEDIPGRSRIGTSQSKALEESPKSLEQEPNNVREDATAQHTSQVNQAEERDVHGTPFEFDGPQTNVTRREPSVTSGQSSTHQGCATSPESSKSDSAKAKLKSPLKDAGLLNGNPNATEGLKAQNIAGYDTPLPRKSDTSSREQHPSPAVDMMVNCSGLSNSSKQEGTRGSRSFQLLPTARQPSTIPEEDEEQELSIMIKNGNDDSELSEISQCHRNSDTQVKPTDASPRKCADAKNDEDLQHGNELTGSFDDHISNLLKKPAESDGSHFPAPAQLNGYNKQIKSLDPGQVQDIGKVDNSRKQTSQKTVSEQNRSVVNFQRGIPAPVKHPELSQQAEQVTVDAQSHQWPLKQPLVYSRLDRPQDLAENQPAVREERTPSQQYAAHLLHTKSQNPQPFTTRGSKIDQIQIQNSIKEPALNRLQQPSLTGEQVISQQRPKAQQHTTTHQPFSRDKPSWKQQTTASQPPVQDKLPKIFADEKEIDQNPLGLERQISLNERPVGQLPTFKCLSQPGAGMPSAKRYLQSLSSELERPSKRARLSRTEQNATPLSLAPDTHTRDLANGYSSDEFFAPKHSDEQMHIDAEIITRLRGAEVVEHPAKPATSTHNFVIGHAQKSSHRTRPHLGSKKIAKVLLETGHSKGMRPGPYQEASPDETSETELWRQSLMARRAQRRAESYNDQEQEKDDDVKSYEGVGDVIKTIVTGALQSLTLKESALHDVFQNYHTGGSRVIHSIVATHAHERQQMMEKHEQRRLSYVHLLEETLGNMRSVRAELKAFDFDQIPAR